MVVEKPRQILMEPRPLLMQLRLHAHCLLGCFALEVCLLCVCICVCVCCVCVCVCVVCVCVCVCARAHLENICSTVECVLLKQNAFL